MRTIVETINEGVYDTKVTITPFEKQMIVDALRQYMESGAYERDKALGSYYKVGEVEAVIDKIERGR